MRLAGVSALLLATLGLGGAATAAAALPWAPGPVVQVRTFADTGLRLGDVVRWGNRFAYIEETTGEVQVGTLAGAGLQHVAAMPAVSEEFRCRTAPAGHGWDTAALYCHSPDNRIYRIGRDGKVSALAALPETAPSDGAVAFDTVGRFGFALLAATGRSGKQLPGGAVYSVKPDGSVERLFDYSGPGGAENALVAPVDFGSQAGSLLLTVDAQANGGRLLALDPKGRETVLARIGGDGLNPLAAIPRATSGVPAPGVYLTDTLSHKVFLVPGAALAQYAPGVLVGAEQRGWLFVVGPVGEQYRTLRLRTTLKAPKFNLEGATSVG